MLSKAMAAAQGFRVGKGIANAINSVRQSSSKRDSQPLTDSVNRKNTTVPAVPKSVEPSVASIETGYINQLRKDSAEHVVPATGKY